MTTPIIGDLIQSTVGKVADKLLDKYLPASMSEKEKAEFRLEMTRLLQEELKAVNQTMQAEAKSEHWIQYSWRPIIGLTFAGTIINNYILLPYFATVGLKPVVIPDGIWSAMLVVLGVAAGTRGWQKIEQARKG